ncbi:MAG: methionine--tRNA ligase [Tenacibaculum sp.]
MNKPKRYTITAALPYTNGPIHIGHLAGVYIPSDIYARYLRATGKEVAFICGSDEHGVAIAMRAKKEGISIREIIDKYHNLIKSSFENFGISFDNYSRTSSALHHKTASDFFKKLHKEGKFTEEITEQLYDSKEEQFLADRFVIGTCPKCANEESYGDQCEKCGISHNSTDLINPRSALTGNVPSLKKTKHWFLPLHKYQDFLKEWILEKHNRDWKPNVLGQVKSWIDDGLRPRAVTRDLNWGIPVPVKNALGKVLYVWFDAPIGYISSTKEWATSKGKKWEDYWQDKDTQLVHFIGKDNIVFHCIIFPAMLKAHGKFILPQNVPANEFLNLEGSKLSTSKNWAVWLHEYLEEFPNKQDVLRYTLTANAPENKDSDFTWKDFQAKNNNELANIYGNFINRAISLTNNYYKGEVPKPISFLQSDRDALNKIKEFAVSIAQSIEQYRFKEALQQLMNLARLGNKYLADEEPWKIVKKDKQRVKSIMYVALQISTSLAILSEPFMPFTANKLKNILKINQSEEQLNWNDISAKSALLKSGHEIETKKTKLLFTKIEDSIIQKQLDKLKAIKKANEAENQETAILKDTINFDDFLRIDLRVGSIIDAERVAKTKKLLKLTVNTGIDSRTIVSGIAESYEPKEIIGQQVLVLCNLASRKLCGILSQGMILMAKTPDGKLSFIQPRSKVTNGSQVY